MRTNYGFHLGGATLQEQIHGKVHRCGAQVVLQLQTDARVLLCVEGDAGR